MTTAMIELHGIVPDLPEDEYHAHPALSSTGARRILDSPARFRYEQFHPQESKPAFDIGSAVHALRLGVGAPIVPIPGGLLSADGGIRSKAAKEFKAEAESRGQLPLKPEVYRAVMAVSEAILAHPAARGFLEQDGTPEASVFSTDPATGVDQRARFDLLAGVAVDLKTTAKEGGASEAVFTKTVSNFGYEVQQEWYLNTLQQITGERLDFVFVVVELEPPYLVGVHQLDADFRRMGAAKAKRARETYAACVAAGEWPGYPAEVQLLSPSGWARREFEVEYA